MDGNIGKPECMDLLAVIAQLETPKFQTGEHIADMSRHLYRKGVLLRAECRRTLKLEATAKLVYPGLCQQPVLAQEIVSGSAPSDITMIGSRRQAGAANGTPNLPRISTQAKMKRFK